MVIVGRLTAFTATNEQSGKIATQEINAEDLSQVVAQCNVRESEEIFSVTKSATGPIYELNNSWILDSGASIHITNHISKFLEINSTSDVNEILWAGNTVIPIEGYGVIEVTVRNPKYPFGRILRLFNVAYVPTMHINVVSLRLLNIAIVHWNTETSCLTYKGRHYADTPSLFNQWVLEYNQV